jgi:hypothetical protein
MNCTTLVSNRMQSLFQIGGGGGGDTSVRSLFPLERSSSDGLYAIMEYRSSSANSASSSLSATSSMISDSLYFLSRSPNSSIQLAPSISPSQISSHGMFWTGKRHVFAHSTTFSSWFFLTSNESIISLSYFRSGSRYNMAPLVLHPYTFSPARRFAVSSSMVTSEGVRL